ncbi:MAG: hypothetical protein JSU02_12330 [Bacteroidetes bacterium]|nr:hypothetical protein [Bacteroidota bacterium]
MNPMERNERYDPEDLEQLMLERSFDELLEEERAFALRHISSRAEYERMRNLLRHLQESGGSTPAPEAHPRVREHVLAAFHAQQQPQWRIWLNSVGGFLFPQRPALYWRPALALGAVAVVFLTARQALHVGDTGNVQLAEVKQTAPAAPVERKLTEQPATDETAPTPAVKAPATPAAATLPSTAQTPVGAAEEEVSTRIAESGSAAEQHSTAQTATPGQAGNARITNEGLADVHPQQAPAPNAGIASVSAAKTETVRTEQDATPAASISDLAKNQGQDAEESASRKRSTAANKEVDKPVAPGYSEDDLLGLLRAAW